MVEKKIICIVLVLVFGVALCVIAAKKILPLVSRNTGSAAPADSQARELMKQLGIRAKISDPFRYLNRYYSRGDLKKLFPEGGAATADELVKKLGPPSMRGSMEQVPGEMWFYVYDEKTANGNPYKSAFIGFMIDDGKVSSWVIDNRNMYSKPRTKKELDSLLKVGMTREQVYRILGEPCNAESFTSVDTYRYRKEDCFIENNLLYDGFRIFYRDGKLEGWLTGHVHTPENAQPLRPGHEDAVGRYRKLAEQGNAQAQCRLGLCYANGQGVKQDYAEAVKWFRKAAEQGNVLAQYNLGVCCLNGTGANKDPAEAVKWFRKAADQGLAQAQYNLGLCYANGQGVSRNSAEAMKWYRKAADQGYAEAQCVLGFCYINGTGVNKDPAEAVKWLRKAAEQGNALAQYNLGVCYINGIGVNKDSAEAVKWYRKAAEQGNALAQYFLGVCCYDGQGVKQDPAEAEKWWRKAADQGYEPARKALKKMNK